MTENARLLRMARMKKIILLVMLAMLAMAGTALGQKDKDDEPTSFVYFVVVKDDNGKPVRCGGNYAFGERNGQARPWRHGTQDRCRRQGQF